MPYATIEDRVEKLEALFGQFLAQMTLFMQHAEERQKAADERQKAADERAEERHRAAEERHRTAEERHRAAEERHRTAEERHRTAEERHRIAEERFARFQEDMREARRELNKKWGDLANKMGTIIEDILAPNLYRLATEHFRFPCVEDFMIRRSRRRAGIQTEYDTLVVGPDAVILGEAKSTPEIEHADAFAQKATRFFECFPEYHGRRLILVLGSWAIPEPVIERLTTLGIYAMRMGDETMELANAAALESPSA